MIRKKVYIIFYFYWDREWFLLLESLRFRFVIFMDEVEVLFDKEDGFYYFYMDG